jgi:outer membrane protein assembly factor BamB
LQILTKTKRKIALITVAVLLMSSFMLTTIQAEAQLSHVGNTPSTTPGYPKLGPLPAGVTPAYTYASHAFMSLSPNPIGVGQSLLVNLWTSPGMYHAFYMQGYKVTVQKPDGSQEVIGPINSYLGDATAWFEYVPDTAGTWKFKFESPGTYMPNGTYWDLPGSETGGFIAMSKYYTLYTSVYYTADSTDWQELTVQPDMVASWPPSPLPTDYWTRPANVVHREWYPILGNYPFSGAYYYPNGRVLYASNYKYHAYVQAPNTGHVVWKRPGFLAGQIGGEQYQQSLPGAFGASNTPAIIYSGRCYQAVTKANATYGATGNQQFFQCYDLRTGQVYWEIPAQSTTTLFMGFFAMTTTLMPTNIVYEYGTSYISGESADIGYTVYLEAISGSQIIKWDPWTGAISSNTSISPISGGTIYDNDKVLSIQTLGTFPNVQYRLINWSMTGSSTNFTSRIYSNITWPYSGLSGDFGGCVDYEAGLAASAGWANPPGPQWCVGSEITMVDLKTGNKLWSYVTNDSSSLNVQNPASFIMTRGKIAFGAHTRVWTCFNALTGAKVWTSDQTEYPWGAWWPYSTASYDFNESKSAIIVLTYEGVYAIDWDTGKILWHYKDSNSVPFENPYDATPFFTGVTMADGKIYTYNGEHTQSQPYSRDWKIHCINATTGELIWKMLNPMIPGAMADGYLTASNPYDGYMYVFGKGQSATTVTAPDVAVPLGTPLTIKGTVLDQSPAQPGTPCVATGPSMETQMEYLHIQMPIDGLWHNETITGVPVTLTAIGSDGTVIDIGSTTTNGYYGTFGKTWTPPKQDTYTIIASFAADDSYGSSNAATTVTVGPAPTTPSTPEIPTPVDTTMTIVESAIAIIIAVVIAVAVAVVLLRKR